MAAFKKLGYSDAQIEEMIEDDKAVDRNEPLPWDMSKEEHKKAMKYANVDEHKKPTEKKAPTVYNWNTEGKTKKENTTKVEIIAALANFLAEQHVDSVICGGIGGGAQTALAEKGIKIFGNIRVKDSAVMFCHVKGTVSE